MAENGDQFYWELAISLEEKRSEIEPKLPNVTDRQFEEFAMIWDILGPLYSYLEKESEK